jgi:hypothetical protein
MAYGKFHLQRTPCAETLEHLAMADFFIELNDDDTIRRILRDGVPDESGVRLEQLYSVVTIYFQLAKLNLAQMRATEDAERKRGHGLQAFLMSLTGLEAFTNTYFLLRAQQLDNTAVEQRIGQTHGSLTRKIRELINLTGDPEVHEQAGLLDRIFGLSEMRNALMHPRWVPSSVLLNFSVPIQMNGLVENRQAQFENEDFCHEAMLWCLLLVARIGESRSPGRSDGFLFHWTGNYGMTLQTILNGLGLDA